MSVTLLTLSENVQILDACKGNFGKFCACEFYMYSYFSLNLWKRFVSSVVFIPQNFLLFLATDSSFTSLLPLIYTSKLLT